MIKTRSLGTVERRTITELLTIIVAIKDTLLVIALSQKRGEISYASHVMVSSYSMLTETHPSWIIDLGAIEHITRGREAYVNFCRIPHGTH